jgi:asparagine synthase (glutamine-hydrolysing)
MCGIAGILRLDGTDASAESVRALSDRLRHRGPDGEGIYLDRSVGLGHRRLSIIDLAGGQQPLANEDGTVWVTFNGEIYNFAELRHQLEQKGHQFRTRSDTEVIVHAYEEWGEKCVERLRGMFAFAIWDERRGHLFLARDRVGIKPLYYLQLPGVFVFASELQALTALTEFEPTVDLQALDLYLHFQYIPSPFSIYREVRKLPPAHSLVVTAERGANEPLRYWNLTFNPNYKPSEAEWIERLDAALRQSVQSHLVSDVPFGAFLSGGVDSSMVVAYMSHAMSMPVKTFSIRFDQAEFDEGSYAQEVANRFSTEHHEEFVRPKALEILPRLVRHYGEPFGDSSAIPTYYVAQVAAQHVKMVLSGDGGDEIFAGYSRYEHLVHTHRGPTGLYRAVRHALGGAARSLGIRPPLPSPSATWYQMVAGLDDQSGERLWLPEYQHLRAQTDAWFHEQCNSAPAPDLCSRFQQLDIRTYLADDILTKVDVASMYHGLEVRVPLLDHVFMELVAEIPSDLKLKRNAASSGAGMVGKYLLKKVGERFYPPAFLNRPKRGFEVPIRDWFADALRPELEDRLLNPVNGLSDFFDLNYIRSLISEHTVRRCHTGRLWSLLFLSEWFQHQHRPAITA